MSSTSSNARVGLAELESPLIRRKSDGFTLLHVFAGGVDCHELLTFLIRAGVHPDTAVSRLSRSLASNHDARPALTRRSDRTTWAGRRCWKPCTRARRPTAQR